MSQTVLIDQNGEKKGKISLPESYFNSKISEGSVYYTVNALLTNRRQGNASTKERGQVKASNAKPWRQILTPGFTACCKPGWRRCWLSTRTLRPHRA